VLDNAFVIPNEFIQTLLSRVDIVGVIDRAVPLKKAGANYAACCPFHTEKSPSFTVSPSKQFYHCFGCGAHGTAISFLMEYQGKSFPDAVEELAHSVGMEVPRDERARQQAQTAGGLYDVLIAAAQHFKTQLKSSEEAIAYFRKRGVSGEIARTFHLGYAPDKWQGLAAAFERYDDPALEESGLVIVGDGDKRYDRFRGRVMFPIFSHQGRVIGFGGRVLGEGEPKYLNSPETPLFSKGRELYGLYQAQKAIRDAGRALVVEGYMDVIALHQFDIRYAVATLGTATTEQHIERLFRLTDEVVFSFDGDKAGQRAAWRALENALPALQDGKIVKFLFLPEEHDPDSYIRAHGQEGFAQRVREAEPLSRYWLRTLQARHTDDSPEARAALLSEAKAYLEKVNAPLIRDVLATEVAAAARIDAADLLRGLKLADARSESAQHAQNVPTAQLPRHPRQDSRASFHANDHQILSNSANFDENRANLRRRYPTGPAPGITARPRATPLSPWLRLLRLGLSKPDRFVSIVDDEIISPHPDALLLQSAVRLAKTTQALPQTGAEIVGLAPDAELSEALAAQLAAQMAGIQLDGKAFDDEWRACIELVRHHARSPQAKALWMNPNNRAPG
jgi:DNA primase